MNVTSSSSRPIDRPTNSNSTFPSLSTTISTQSLLNNNSNGISNSNNTNNNNTNNNSNNNNGVSNTNSSNNNNNTVSSHTITNSTHTNSYQQSFPVLYESAHHSNTNGDLIFVSLKIKKKTPGELYTNVYINCCCSADSINCQQFAFTILK